MRETPGKGTTKKGTIKEAAVSEIMGIVLLTGIVVIMLSALGVTVFSLDGPDDVPHTRMQAWVDSSESKIYLKHSGGEFLDIQDCEILLNFNGEKYVYPSDKFSEGLRNESVWRLGEVVTIETRSTWGIDIKNDDEIELFLVDIPSKQPIQIARLTKEYEKRPSLRIWITPKGKIIDTSGGYGDLKQIKYMDSTKNNDVQDPHKSIMDRNCTTYRPSKGGINTSEYQEFDFKINPLEYGVDPGYTFSNVTLKIVYYSKDNAIKEVKIKIYDDSEPDKWVYLENLPKETDSFDSKFYDITNYIHNAEEISKFKVRIEAYATNLNQGIYVDYIAIWIE